MEPTRKRAKVWARECQHDPQFCHRRKVDSGILDDEDTDEYDAELLASSPHDCVSPSALNNILARLDFKSLNLGSDDDEERTMVPCSPSLPRSCPATTSTTPIRILQPRTRLSTSSLTMTSSADHDCYGGLSQTPPHHRPIPSRARNARHIQHTRCNLSSSLDDRLVHGSIKRGPSELR